MQDRRSGRKWGQILIMEVERWGSRGRQTQQREACTVYCSAGGEQQMVK
jgi:hypothetical protein